MGLPRRGGDWARVFGVALLSLLLYFPSVVFVLFLVPLQVTLVRRGRGEFFIASAITLVGILAFTLVRAAGLPGDGDRNWAIAMVAASTVVLLAGAYALNVPIFGIRRRLFRLLVVTGAAGVVSIPFLVQIAADPLFTQALKTEIQIAVNVLNSSFSTGGNGQASETMGLPDVDRMTQIVRDLVLRNYLFGFFVGVAAMWRIATLFTYRFAESRPAPLSSFTVPEAFLWPVLAAWAVVLGDRLLGFGVGGFLAWNAGMIGAFVYGLQGVGLFLSLLSRWRASRGVRVLLLCAFIFVLFWPGIGLVVLLAFPILGLSALWVRYPRNVPGTKA